MRLCKCNYICMYIGIMQLCLYCQHLTNHSKDILMMRHSSYTKKILIQFLKNISLFGAYGKFRCSLSRSYATLYFLVYSMDFFFEIFQHDGTQQVETGNFNVNIFIKILLLRKWEFRVLRNETLGKVEIHASEGNYKFCYGLNFYQLMGI